MVRFLITVVISIVIMLMTMWGALAIYFSIQSGEEIRKGLALGLLFSAR